MACEVVPKLSPEKDSKNKAQDMTSTDTSPVLSPNCPDFVSEMDARLRRLGRLPGQIEADPEAVRRHWQGVLGLVDRKRPTRWTEDLVADRLIEARQTLARMPMTTRPGGYKTAWPAFQGMTEAEISNLQTEAYHAGTLKQLHADRNRVRIPPSQEAISRMEETIAWVARYLGDDQHSAIIVTGWDGDRPGNGLPAPVRAALHTIAQGLNRDRVAVR